MSLDLQVKEILMRNHNIRKLKNDESVKSNSIRVLNLLSTYGLYKLGEDGKTIGTIPRELEDFTNFELLHLIENVILSNNKILMDEFLSKSIQSIDSGKCWYYPKELSIIIFEATEKRHNYRKIKAILNQFVKDNICLKVTNKKHQSMYRILFTHTE